MFKAGKHCRCRNYELDADWNPNWTACKFFTKDEIEEIKGQMNIFDFVCHVTDKALLLIINKRLYDTGIISQEVYQKIILQINKC